MGVRLMADIEHETVFWRINERMNGQDDLDRTERRSNMAACLRGGRDDFASNLIGENRKLVIGKQLQISWGVYAVENSAHNTILT